VAEEERGKVQKTIRYPSNVVCYKCGVQRVICRRWSADGRVLAEDQKNCQFYGILIGVVYGVKHGYGEIWDRWKERACKRGLAVGKDTDVVEALASETLNECGGSEMLHAFMWMTDRMKRSVVDVEE
jgi:hypothetical protein